MSAHERRAERASAAPRLDHGRLRHGRRARGLRGAGDRRARRPTRSRSRCPSGKRVAFALGSFERGEDFARAGVVKDAGDDPDVTHGALVCATVRRARAGRGRAFSRRAKGVGTVTRPGLPLPPGEPAINPVPRAMMRQTIEEAAAEARRRADAEIEISIPGGEEMAKHTLNGRLGIVGGLSILGTTGIVTPFSCAAWIDSIHRGVDVARASGLDPYRRRDRLDLRSRGAGALRSAGAGADRDGRFRRRLAEISARASGRARHHRRRLRQDDQARAGAARSAFGPLQRRFRATCRKRARRGRGDDMAARIVQANSALDALQIAQGAGVDLAARDRARRMESGGARRSNADDRVWM